MSTASLMKRKSSFTRRRFIIFFLLATIVTVSVMTGFSKGLNSDTNNYSANGERVVMWEELPQSGTPDDYDLVQNLKFTAQKLYTASYFRGETVGTVTANVGLGIKYNQNVHNTRVKKENALFAEAISSSALKSVAEQKYFYGEEIVLFRPAENVDGDAATYADSVGRIDLDSYFEAYGVRPNELAKHYISAGSILSATDANVATKAAALGSEDGDFAFDRSQKLTKDENGNYSVHLVLDPAESTKYNRSEVRTLAGADQNPVYYSVEMTVTFNSAWEPVSVKTDENYDIAIPVLGAMNCTSSLTETFYDINKPDGVMPEQEFFESHLDASEMQLGGAGSSPADYLAAAFADYLDGSKPLDLKADISVDALSLDSVMLSLSLGSPMRVKALLGSAAIEYGDDKLKIKLNDIKGYLPISALDGIIKDPTVEKLLGDSLLSDISSIIGPDILSKVFEGCVMEKGADGVQSIHLDFALSEDIRVNAYIYIRDEDKTLLRIEGYVRLYGKDVNLRVVPETANIPDMSDCTQDLSPLADYIPAILGFASGDTYGINGTLNILGNEAAINAYIDRSDGTLKLQAEIDGFGTKIPLTYVDGTVYFKVGNFALKLNVDSADELKKALEYTGIDFSVLQFSDKSLTKTLFAALDSIKSITLENNSATVNVDLLGVPASLSLIKADGKLKGVQVSVDGEVNGNKVEGGGTFELTNPEKRKVEIPDGEYINIIAVADIIKPITDLVNEGKAAKTLTLEIAGRLELDGGYLDIACDDFTVALDGSAFKATLKLGGEVGLEVVYTSGALYIKLGNLANGVIDDEQSFALSLDKNTDFERLSDILAQYLPEYLVNEIDNLLGIKRGEARGTAERSVSASDIELLIKQLAGIDGTNVSNIINTLLSPIDPEHGNGTALSKLLDMLELHYNNQTVTATATAAGFSVSITPTLQSQQITGGKISLSSVKSDENGVVTTNSVGVLNITDLAFSDAQAVFNKPSGEYISIMEYVELINNIVNTFTTASGLTVDDITGGAQAVDKKDKLITFEVPAIPETAPITYNIKKIVKDENGEEKLEKNGIEAVYEKKISISTYDGLSLLKGRIETLAESGKTSIMLEAHLMLDIDTLKDTYGAIKLDLYVKDGCAYLKYREGKTGMGETLSIDFDSVSQILAAALKILGVDGSLVDEIFGENSIKIDSSVFESMNIPGFDDIRSAVGNIADTALSVKTAMQEVGKAWAIVQECTSMNELRSRFDELSSHISAALDAFKKDGKTKEVSEVGASSNKPADLSALVGVLRGVDLGVIEGSGEKTLYADIDNSITVKPQFSAGTGKNARVSVTQTTGVTDGNGPKNTVKGIAISNLDVKTAILDGAITLIAGDPDITVNVPADITQNAYDGDKEVSTYSDLSNIKHLLFDLMNTANLMKFEMGGGDGDVISLKIGSLYTVPIKFKAMVEIIPNPDPTAEVPYETVAAVSLHTDYNFLVTNTATTYLYIYKDNIYLHGVDSVPTIGSVTYKDWVYKTSDLGALFSDIKNGFMPKFLYRMIAVTSTVKDAINGKIPDGSSDSSDPSLKTIAQIFTGYKYEKLDPNSDNSPYVHTIGLHLGNLLGNTTMQGITVQLSGANNEDDKVNVTNNYIQHLYVRGVLARFLGMDISVNITATLENVKENTEKYTENGTEKTRVVSIESKPLSPLNGAYMSKDDVPSGTANVKLIFDDYTDLSGATVKSVINDTPWEQYA